MFIGGWRILRLSRGLTVVCTGGEFTSYLVEFVGREERYEAVPVLY